MSDEGPKEYRQYRFVRPPGACELLLVRHGESAPARFGENFPERGGHADPPLDPVGVAQAERAAERLAAEPVSRIYVSPLQRTRQTAAPLVARLGIEPEEIDDLREVHLGEWENGGLFRKHVSERHPLAQRMFAEGRWDVIPGAEPGDVFATRVERAMRTIADANPDATVAVFAHGGVIGQAVALAARSTALVFAGCDNGSISHLVISSERWIVRRYNDTAHIGAGFTLAAEPLI